MPWLLLMLNKVFLQFDPHATTLSKGAMQVTTIHNISLVPGGIPHHHPPGANISREKPFSSSMSLSHHCFVNAQLKI